MRRFGAISLAAFYLLLTTGMFVCLVHCGAEFLFGKPEHELTELAVDEHMDHGHDEKSLQKHDNDHGKGKAYGHKKSCGKDKDCSCCNQHGNYVIKENSTSSPEFQLSALHVAPLFLPYDSAAPVRGIFEAKISWFNATGPPRSAVQRLFITHRSLLI
ncbi:hypothetical protein [Mucilaginibacter sp. 44-25]|uniref:hypothetical protein n=1 Tax=Mucilaginibacter sp. 44-25 TaxID=1895794 RepID=UPI000A7C8877|nr:hypothetical protein [Mucilaginibacter sp. 44-25]